MSKELEALKIGIPKLKKLYENNAKKMSQNDILGFDLVFVYLDKALHRLESIDNANHSEALECLEYMENKLKDLEYIAKQNNNEYLLSKYIPSEKFSTIKQSLLKAQEQEKENTRNEEILQKYYQEGITLDSVRALKQERDNYKRVLDIIKEKNVDIKLLKLSSSWLDYYTRVKHKTGYDTEITEEEFDLLKRWLG